MRYGRKACRVTAENGILFVANVDLNLNFIENFAFLFRATVELLTYFYLH